MLSIRNILQLYDILSFIIPVLIPMWLQQNLAMNDSIFQLGSFIDDNLLFLSALFMLFVGFGIAWLFYSPALSQARHDIERIQLKRQAEEQIHAERLQALEYAQTHMQNSFTALSQHALKENNTQFLQLAQETLMRFQNSAQSDMEHRKQSIQMLIEPVQKALDKTREQIQSIEKERRQSFGAVSEQLKTLTEDQESLRLETRNLVTALRRPEVRGQWGEVTLKRIVELAGMMQYCDFVEQPQHSNDERTIRPDLIVKMPDSRELIIDAKTPLDAYLEATSTDDDEVRKREFLRHAKIVRNHMRELSSKRYWEQFDASPDFVVLFVPGEQFLGAALEYDKKLLQDALSERVILASPTSLIALLRAVAFGWKQVSLDRNAEKIRDLGEELYKRVATFTEHMARLGKSLNNSVDNYNKALGSLERSILPGAKRFSELGIQERKTLSDTEIVEKVARKPVDSG
jgi:DNA recombination protein RmuC